METEEPWESLDIDETDISSSLSPLRRCNSHHQRPPPPTTVSPRRIIPGPAAAVQAAMHRKTRFDSHPKQPFETSVSTQEYIRRFQEDSSQEFLRSPWVSALDYLRNHGMVDTTPLKDIKKCVNAERINKVVGVVKSCSQNGLGDMKITLKDPTDTIDATVHGKVLSIAEFGKLITVGSVLILQKVVAFSSSYTSCYLNITRGNIAKVISVEVGVQSFPEANQDSTPVLSADSVEPVKTSVLVCGRSERNIGNVNQSFSTKGKTVIAELSGNKHYTQPRSQDSSRQIENAADKISDEPLHIDLDYSGHSSFDYYSKRQGGTSGRTSQPGPGSLEGIFRNLQDLDNNGRQQARDSNTAPSMIENQRNGNWQANDTQFDKLLRGNNCNRSTAEKLETIVMPTNVDDFDVRRQYEVRGNGPAPVMVENLAKRDRYEINGGPKTIQRIETGSNTSEVAEQDALEPTKNEVKKQRLGLISRSAVQEWTDEQLCILDMDED